MNQNTGLLTKHNPWLDPWDTSAVTQRETPSAKFPKRRHKCICRLCQVRGFSHPLKTQLLQQILKASNNSLVFSVFGLYAIWQGYKVKKGSRSLAWSFQMNVFPSWLKLRYPPQSASQCNRQTFVWRSTQLYCFSLTPKCSSLCCILCDEDKLRQDLANSGYGRNVGDVSVSWFSIGYGSLTDKVFLFGLESRLGLMEAVSHKIAWAVWSQRGLVGFQSQETKIQNILCCLWYPNTYWNLISNQ